MPCCLEDLGLLYGFNIYVLFYLFVDAESQAWSPRDVLLIVGLPIIIKLVITSALLGNLPANDSGQNLLVPWF